MAKVKFSIVLIALVAFEVACTNNAGTSANTGDSTVKSVNKMSENSGSEDSMKTGGAVKRKEKSDQ